MGKTIDLNFERDSKQYKKLEKQAKRSYVPYIILCALGIVSLVVGFTILTIAIALEGGVPTAYDDASPRYYLLKILSNIFVYGVTLGCLGAGIPLLVITIVNRAKAKKTLVLYENAHKGDATVAPVVEEIPTVKVEEPRVEEAKTEVETPKTEVEEKPAPKTKKTGKKTTTKKEE